MVNHYEGHVISQNIEHNLRQDILHWSLHYIFIWNIHLKYFASTQNHLLETFATFPIHGNHLNPNIEDMMIIYFYHNLPYIC